MPFLGTLAAAALLALTATAARAGTLTSASWVENVLGVPIPVPVLASGTSTSTSVFVSLEIPEFQFEILTPVASFGAITRVRLTAGGSAMLSAGPGMAAASKGLPASARAALQTASNAPFYDWYRVRFAPGAIRIPPATATQSFTLFGHKVYVFAGSYGWTSGAVTLTGLTYYGGALPDAKAHGSFDLTAFGAGTVTLVAPRRIRHQPGHPSIGFERRTVGSFTTLTLHFVPEPGTLLLLAAGTVGLWVRVDRARR